jgi:hypothetical protein
MNTEYVCKYCKKEFTTKGNLTTHIKKAKKCLNMRNSNSLKCESPDCDYTSSTKELIIKHQYQCTLYIIYKENQVIGLQNKNETLENILKREQNKTTTINNINKTSTITHNKQTISNNKLSIEVRDEVFGKLLLPCNELFESIPQYIQENFNRQHILGDKQAIYDFITNMVNQKMYYVCLDKIGSNFIYKDHEGSIKTDVYARKLIDNISEPLLQVVEQITNNEIQRLADNIVMANDEQVAKRNTKIIKDIRIRKNIVKNIKNGDKNLRRNLADKIYYPPQMIEENREDPQRMLKSGKDEELTITSLSEVFN